MGGLPVLLHWGEVFFFPNHQVMGKDLENTRPGGFLMHCGKEWKVGCPGALRGKQRPLEDGSHSVACSEKVGTMYGGKDEFPAM